MDKGNQASEGAAGEDLRDVLRRGIDEFAAFVNPLAVERARLSGEPLDLVAVQQGALVAADGRVYHDFLSGYGTQALGHRSPPVEQALRAFLDTPAPSFYPSGASPFAGRLARRLAERTGYESVSLSSSGTEAVEAALKLARAATGRARILGFQGAYHGCTLGSLALMAQGPYRDPFGPHLRGVEVLPHDDPAALAAALAAGDVAAVLAEPIQVEGGVRPLPPAVLEVLATEAPRRGALVIADEAQTGLCRTGRFLASDAWPRRPDAVVLAKALGGGLLPLSALLTRPEIFRAAYGTVTTAESHQYTFAGNALCAVAGLAALPLLSDDLAARVGQVGARFGQALAQALAPLPLVAEIRGAGLLWGIALRDADHPWLSFEALGLPELGGRPSVGPLLCHRLGQRGYLVQVAGHDWRVVRLQPPLDIDESQLRAFVRACRESLEALCQLA